MTQLTVPLALHRLVTVYAGLLVTSCGMWSTRQYCTDSEAMLAGCLTRPAVVHFQAGYEGWGHKAFGSSGEGVAFVRFGLRLQLEARGSHSVDLGRTQ